MGGAVLQWWSHVAIQAESMQKITKKIIQIYTFNYTTSN
jgi:hypothetical protein